MIRTIEWHDANYSDEHLWVSKTDIEKFHGKFIKKIAELECELMEGKIDFDAETIITKFNKVIDKSFCDNKDIGINIPQKEIQTMLDRFANIIDGAKDDKE